jgi:predicted ATP-grasp superfamily ATP-dependent carboligase
MKEFSQSFNFLTLLLNTRLPISQDELIAACLRHLSQAHEDRHAFLVAAGKELALLLSGQFDQFKATLERIKE